AQEQRRRPDVRVPFAGGLLQRAGQDGPAGEGTERAGGVVYRRVRWAGGGGGGGGGSGGGEGQEGADGGHAGHDGNEEGRGRVEADQRDGRGVRSRVLPGDRRHRQEREGAGRGREIRQGQGCGGETSGRGGRYKEGRRGQEGRR